LPAVNQEQQILHKVTCPKKQQAEKSIDRSYKLSTDTTWIANQRIGYTSTLAERITNRRGGGYTTSSSVDGAPAWLLFSLPSCLQVPFHSLPLHEYYSFTF